MTDNVSGVLLVYVLASPIIAIIVHIISCRFSRKSGGHASPQKFLAKLIVFLNIPVLTGVWIIGYQEMRVAGDILLMILFTFLVFNGIAYAYFHFFNMSETARRINILLKIRQYGVISESDLITEYSPRNMIISRLERLLQMNQITKGADGRYRINGRLLLYAARIIKTFRDILRLGSPQ